MKSTCSLDVVELSDVELELSPLTQTAPSTPRRFVDLRLLWSVAQHTGAERPRGAGPRQLLPTL